MSSNTWLTTHAQPLEQMKKFLTECEYKPEFDDFPLRPLQKILNGSEAEIRRLHNENAQLKSALKQVNEMHKEVSTPKDEDITGA